MTEFQNKAIKKLYVKSKLVVKRWEEEFSNENGRLPTKADIKLSPAFVRESYNRYYKIKTELLASQILIEEDSIESNFSKLDELNHTFETAKTSQDIKDTEEDKSTEYLRCNEPVNDKEVKEIDPKTWGENLNVKKIDSKEKKKKCSSLDILSQKLFKGTKFKKRNPRKAPLFSKKRAESVTSETNKITLSPKDLNSSCAQLNCLLKESNDNESLMSEQSGNLNNTGDSMDSSIYSLSSPSLSSSSLFLSSQTMTPVISKCSVLDKKLNTTVQKLSFIQEITEGTCKTAQNIQEDWVERCIDQSKENSMRNSDSGFDSLESSSPLLELKNQPNPSSSDDDVICDSDNELGKENGCTNSSRISHKRKLLSLNVHTAHDRMVALNKNEEDSFSNEAHPFKKIKLSLNVDVTEKHEKENSRKTILHSKIKSGTLNENYVKINLDKKIYARGKKNFNFSKYKKQQWKKNKKLLNKNLRESGGTVRCYKCGKEGHFGRKCKTFHEDKLLEVDDESIERDTDILPTLEEAQKMAEEKKEASEENLNSVKIEAFYQSIMDDGESVKTPPEVYETLKIFGHSEFRPGQEVAIMRILSGMSTLLMISTGGGKSLCYQLPAYLYAKRSKCITLVISPLVSLMEDQVSGSSSVFKAGCLHTSQTEKQRESVLEDVNKGKLHALLVSPEAVVSGDSFKGLGNAFKKLPPIAFACIDEVHCISQWSHNFRPSYLMINKVLKEKFGVTTVLGLTATATVSSVKSIAKELGLSVEKDVIRDTPLPENLFLSISRDENKDEALIRMLQSSKFQEFNAILIYCTRRDDCERLAILIRTVLQNSAFANNQKKLGKKLSWSAESYHAGMAAARRKQVQKAFMTGNLRIVVATLAFGMGINKQDIRAVIHYNMPKDFESYVQETGRGGRDGLPAYCHLFLDSGGRDLSELRKHIYSNTIDRYVLRKLLQRVFIGCDCKEKGEKCKGHEVAFDMHETIQALDIPEENINTLLCYLELHEKNFIKVLAPAYINCKVRSYNGVRQIYSAATKCPPLAYVCALNAQAKKKNLSSLEFNVIETAKKINWDSSIVKMQLKNLEWEVKDESRRKKTGILVDFCDLGFRVLARGDMSEAELDEALDYLTERVENEEKRSLHLLNLTFSTLDHFAKNKCSDMIDQIDEDNSNGLKMAIRSYFETETMAKEIPLKNFEAAEFDEEMVASDIHTLICTYRDSTFNARSVARIFHGIQSPNYPASFWSSCRFWRKHLDKDFNKIIRIAKMEILRQKF